MADDPDLSVSAIAMTQNRVDAIGEVLDRLLELPVTEVIIADNGSVDGTQDVVSSRAPAWEARNRTLRLLCRERNDGVAARNAAIIAASGKYLLLIDDDSYPLPGTIESLIAALRASPTTAIAAGLVLEVDEQKRVLNSTEPGSFDWMMRAGSKGAAPPEGFPTYFFPEGASLARRAPLVELGGYYEPFFFTHEGFELTARLLSAGWDVRYVPHAPFHHMKPPKGRGATETMFRLGVRNQLWYFWLRFPPLRALLRMPAYAAYDLLQAVYRGMPGAWAGGVADAWRQRANVRHDRSPMPRGVVRRAELTRGRDHLRLCALMAMRALRRLGSANSSPR